MRDVADSVLDKIHLAYVMACECQLGIENELFTSTLVVGTLPGRINMPSLPLIAMLEGGKSMQAMWHWITALLVRHSH